MMFEAKWPKLRFPKQIRLLFSECSQTGLMEVGNGDKTVSNKPSVSTSSVPCNGAPFAKKGAKAKISDTNEVAGCNTVVYKALVCEVLDLVISVAYYCKVPETGIDRSSFSRYS